jgi:hypothetical protein
MPAKLVKTSAPSGAPWWTYTVTAGVAVVGALVSVGGLTWTVWNGTTQPAKSKPTTTIRQEAKADQGGMAINASGRATVLVGGEATPKQTPAAAPGVADSSALESLHQTAQAASSSVAVNASDAASVALKRPQSLKP